MFQNRVHSAHNQRLEKLSLTASDNAASTATGCVTAFFIHFYIGVTTISTAARPTTRRISANYQPRTKPMDTSIAGLDSGLSIRNVSALPVNTYCLRVPAATDVV